MGTIIHHYTNIEVLSLILKNRTLRFNRLDRVDDPEESNFISNGVNLGPLRSGDSVIRSERMDKSKKRYSYICQGRR